MIKLCWSNETISSHSNCILVFMRYGDYICLYVVLYVRLLRIFFLVAFQVSAALEVVKSYLWDLLEPNMQTCPAGLLRLTEAT